MENILILAPLVLGSCLVTILLWLTGKKVKDADNRQIEFGKIPILNSVFSIIILVYLVRLFIMFVTGLLSNAFEEAIIGSLFAVIPLIVLFLTRVKDKSKVQT